MFRVRGGLPGRKACVLLCMTILAVVMTATVSSASAAAAGTGAGWLSVLLEPASAFLSEVAAPEEDMMRVAVVPSNQHHNYYPGVEVDGELVTEEDWALRVSEVCVDELRVLGCEARLFHVPGEGLTNTDETAALTPEILMFDPDLVLFIHSDCGAPGRIRSVMAVVDYGKAWATVLAEAVATQLDLPVRPTRVFRREPLQKRLRDGGYEGKSVLLEIGQHYSSRDAKWNWDHINEIGVAIARGSTCSPML